MEDPTESIDIEDEGEIITEQDIAELDLLGFLKSDSNGLALLNIKKNNSQLANTSRSRLSRLIIKRELEKVITSVGNSDLYSSDFTLSKKLFLTYTNSIVKIFPSEKRGTYYTGYSNAGGFKITAKGKLYDNYVYTKYKLREDGVLAIGKSVSLSNEAVLENPSSSEASTESDSVCSHELQSLKTEVLSEITLQEYWSKTYEERRLLLMKNRMSVNDYFHLFPCLSSDLYAVTLLSSDFERLFPGKSENFLSNWSQFKTKIIVLIDKLKSIKDVDDLALKKLINVSDSGSQDAIILHLLPYLTGQPFVGIPEEQQIEKVGAKRKRKATKRRATLLENRESFFIVSSTVGNIEEDIRVKKAKLLDLKLPLQPLPVFIGTLLNIVDAYVVVDDIKYRTKSPVAAIDLTFKIFETVDCEYPASSLYSWLLIKKLGYDIDIRENDLSITMKSLLNDFKNPVV